MITETYNSNWVSRGYADQKAVENGPGSCNPKYILYFFSVLHIIFEWLLTPLSYWNVYVFSLQTVDFKLQLIALRIFAN